MIFNQQNQTVASQINIGGRPLPYNYKWTPQVDITTYELALCMPIFDYVHQYNRHDLINKLPSYAKRHWELV